MWNEILLHHWTYFVSILSGVFVWLVNCFLALDVDFFILITLNIHSSYHAIQQAYPLERCLFFFFSWWWLDLFLCPHFFSDDLRLLVFTVIFAGPWESVYRCWFGVQLFFLKIFLTKANCLLKLQLCSFTETD